MATRPQDVGTPRVIETARLRLEPWSDAHFERFARFMRDPAVIRYIRAEPLDRASAIEQHEHSLAEWELYGFGKRAIIEAGHVPLARIRRAVARRAGQGLARRRRRDRLLRAARPLAPGDRDGGGDRELGTRRSGAAASTS